MMGILNDLLGKVWSRESKDWTFGQIDPMRVKAPYAIEARPLEAGKEYVKVMMRTMRITHVRKGVN